MGETGWTGPTGSKEAILELAGTWRALTCIEAPQVWFFDVLAVPRGVRSLAVDPLFLEAVEPGSLVILASHPPSKASIVKNRVVFPHKRGGRILLAGIRRGMTQRFAARTAAEARKNRQFWNWRAQ